MQAGIDGVNVMMSEVYQEIGINCAGRSGRVCSGPRHTQFPSTKRLVGGEQHVQFFLRIDAQKQIINSLMGNRERKHSNVQTNHILSQ